jgi:predicted ArsR family transcriptional regulator
VLDGTANGLPDDSSFSAVVAAVTSAFGDATRRQIYLHARDTDGVTTAEIAQRFALHPNVARHHLDKLAAGGYLDVTLDHGGAGAGAGRPSKRYRRSSRAAALPAPPRPDGLVVTLLVRALALLEPAVATQMAE